MCAEGDEQLNRVEQLLSNPFGYNESGDENHDWGRQKPEIQDYEIFKF